MQIRSRLTLTYTVLVSCIMLISFVAIYFSSAQYSENEFYGRLRVKGITTAELLFKVDEIDTTLLKLIDRSNRDVLHKENITIYDVDNEVIYANGDVSHLDVSPQLLDEIRIAGAKRMKSGDYDVLGVKYQDKYNRFVIISSAVDVYGKSKLANLRFILIILFMGVAVVVTVSGWFFAGRALKPITRIVNEVENFSPQHLEKRLDVGDEQDEIDRLAATFNKLLDRMEMAFNVQKTFVANVSHELKNPLTKITSQLEVSILKERKTEDYVQTIQSVLEDIKELNQLSNSLLDLARVSGDKNMIPRHEHRVDEIIWSARDFLINNNSSYKAVVNYTTLPEDDRMSIRLVNETLLKLAFVNLMENACKFSSDNKVDVDISVGSTIKITFFNKGKQISPEDLAHIFQPFYRSVNTADVKGYGIGLSLVERIIHFHNGKVNAGNVKEGVMFTIELP